MAWYILVGHNWNAAATNIDDRIGSMEGYTVILCKGSIPSLVAQNQESLAQPMLEEQNFGQVDSHEHNDEDEVILSVQEAADIYREKDAQVVTLHTDDVEFYRDPVVVSKNGKRIGIFAVDGPRSDIAARIIAKQLRDVDVDFIICLIDDPEAIELGLGSVDLAVCTDYDDAGSDGRYSGHTFVVGTPYVGEVNAVVVSPSGFLLSKMLDVA